MSPARCRPAAGLAVLEKLGRLTVDEVRRVFGVSVTAARIRIQQFVGRRSELLSG